MVNVAQRGDMLAKVESADEPASPAFDEATRLATLHSYRILDTLPEQMFDDIARLAASICNTPIALVSLVDAERQWFKAQVGLDVQQTPRALAFCAHAILRPDELMEVTDASLDLRFIDNALVTDDPKIRFYAGAPIVTPDGHALGTVCAIDSQARTLTVGQQEALRSLARQTSRLLEYRRHSELRHSRLANEVERSRERLIQISAASTESMDIQAFVDLDYVYRYVNDAYVDYWGVGREQIEGHKVLELMGAGMFEEHAHPMIKRAMAGERCGFDGEFHFPGRGGRHIRGMVVPVRDGTAAIVGVVMRANDVSELKQTQQELRDAVAELVHRTAAQQRFIDIISHDLREPVNTICNFSDLVVRRHADALGPDGQRYLSFVLQGGTRIRALLDDLLSFIRLEGRAVIGAEVNLGSVVDSAIADLALAIERTGARVALGAMPQVHGDATLLRLVFQNLISNAIKFTRPGVAAVVEIQARDQSDGALIEVRDNGIGIEAEHFEQLFGMFKRLRTRRQYEGTGLGLAICKRIIDLHGGQIRVSSQVGQGSRFTVFLPSTAMAHDPGGPE
jgi:PAS domain S-box-containing protein